MFNCITGMACHFTTPLFLWTKQLPKSHWQLLCRTLSLGVIQCPALVIRNTRLVLEFSITQVEKKKNQKSNTSLSQSKYVIACQSFSNGSKVWSLKKKSCRLMLYFSVRLHEIYLPNSRTFAPSAYVVASY